jgi:transcriptional regulator with XRE-family HTH domain
MSIMTINTSKIIADLRKQKDWSQTDLASKSGVSREMIGKYERGDAVPSIEAAKKIADTLGVSLDYLVGEGANASFDKKTLKRLEDIHKLEPDVQDKLFFFIDTVIRDSKARKAYA